MSPQLSSCNNHQHFPTKCWAGSFTAVSIVINSTTQGDMLKIKQLRAEIKSLEASQGSTWDSISAPCRGRWVEHSLSFAFARQDPPPTTETASALHLRLRFGLGSLKPDKSQLHLAALIFSNRAFRLICHFFHNTRGNKNSSPCKLSLWNQK